MMTRAWSLPAFVNNTTKPLVGALAQYPVLECLVSHLHIRDVLSLAAVSQAASSYIRMYDPQAKANILSKALCPGHGIYARSLLHCPCRTNGWHATTRCAGQGFDTESRPCITCGINTCDECRIHVTYQAYMEDPGLDKHRWWAGFFMMNRNPMAIYPPKETDIASWFLEASQMRSHHDQGRLHMPLTVPGIADPEPIDRMLDTNLGRGPVRLAGRTNLPFEGHRISSFFNSVAGARVEMMCQPWFEKIKGDIAPGTCSCTFRKRFLDRWMCLLCHVKELHADAVSSERDEFDEETGEMISCACPCGCTIINQDDDYVSVCNWCRCEIVCTRPNEETISEHSESSDEDEEFESSESSMPWNHLTFGHKQDGTLAVFLNGKKLHGETVGRAVVEGWKLRHGEELGCSCCHCGESHVHGDDEEMHEATDHGLNHGHG